MSLRRDLSSLNILHEFLDGSGICQQLIFWFFQSSLLFNNVDSFSMGNIFKFQLIVENSYVDRGRYYGNFQNFKRVKLIIFYLKNPRIR